jgi:hypothetical protein
MPKKHAGTAKLRKRFAERETASKYADVLRQLAFPEPERAVDWSDPKFRPFFADRALALREWDAALKKAFAVAKLDPADPFNWRDLLHMFAEHHFGRSAKGRPPRKWYSKTWCQLLADYSCIEQQNPKASDTQICQKIIKSFGARYEGKNGKKIDTGTLRRNLAYAKDPNKNEYLQRLSKDIAPLLERHLLDNEIEFSDAFIRTFSLERALKVLCAEWGSPSFRATFF